MSHIVAQSKTTKADARLTLRLPTNTLDLVDRAARENGRSTSAMAVRLMQMGIAAMVADGRMTV